MAYRDKEKQRAYQRKWYKENKSVLKIGRKANYLSHRNRAKEAIQFFKKDGCGVCDEKVHCCLVAHHVNPKDKLFALGNLHCGKYTAEIVAIELKKCVCLCQNCHSKFHAGLLEINIVQTEETWVIQKETK